MVRTQSNDPTFTLKRNVTCQLIYKLTTISLETGTVNSEVTVIDGFAKLLDSVIIFFFTSQLPWRPDDNTLYCYHAIGRKWDVHTTQYLCHTSVDSGRGEGGGAVIFPPTSPWNAYYATYKCYTDR